MTGLANVVYRDFAGGDYGLTGGFHANPNQFSGRNVVVEKDGTIHPRAGLWKHTVTGNVSGRVWGARFIGFPGKLGMLVVNDHVYWTDTTGDFTMTLVDDMNAAATEPVAIDFYDPNGTVFLSNPDDKTYAIDWPASTMSSFQVASLDRGFRTMRLYRDRLYFADDQGTPPEVHPAFFVYYSEPADFTNAPDINFFEVGYFWDVVCLIPLGNTLLIGKRQDGWWALVGGLNTGTLRQLRTDLPPCIAAVSQQEDTVLENGNVWFFRTGGQLCVTNGAVFDDKSWAHLQLAEFNAHRFGLYDPGPGQDIVFVADNGFNVALVRHWGTWSYLSFDTDALQLSGMQMLTDTTERFILVANDLEEGSTADYYSLDLSLGRPGFIGDPFSNPGDDSDTPVDAFFYMPEFYDRQGRDVAVRAVVIDYVKYNWDAGAGADNTFTLDVRTFARQNEPSGTTDNFISEFKQWSEPTTLGGAPNGIVDRQQYNFGANRWGGAFQIGLTDIVGVSIKSITVTYQTSESTERSGF